MTRKNKPQQPQNPQSPHHAFGLSETSRAADEAVLIGQCKSSEYEPGEYEPGEYEASDYKSDQDKSGQDKSGQPKVSEFHETVSSHKFKPQDKAGFNHSLDLRQISHDLNNYLTILLIHLDSLRDELSENAQKRTKFELLHDNLRLAASIVNELSYPTDTQPAIFMSVDAFHLFLEEQMSVWRLLTGGAMEIQLKSLAPTDRSLFITIIPNYAKRACMQIIRNAAEAVFTHNHPEHSEQKSPSLSLWLENTANMMRLHIKDNGPGIPPDIANSIFTAGVSSHDG